MSIVDWASHKTTDMTSQYDEQTLAILPIGAVEQHGPHLPLGTDSLILEALLERLRGRSLARGRALLLPLLPVGFSPEHRAFAGTLTISAEPLLAVWCDIGRSVAASGVRRLLFLNSHGGNGALAQIAAMRLRDEAAVAAAVLTTHRLGAPEGFATADEQRYGVHAGRLETALVRAIAPDLVDEAAVQDFAPREKDLATPAASYTGGIARQAWRIEDLHPSGAVGDAAAARPGDGEALMEHLVAGTLDVIDGLLALPLPPLSR